MFFTLFSAQANTVITANEAVRDGKIIPLKAMVDEAVEGCDCVKQVFVAQRTGATVPMYGRDIPMEQVITNTILNSSIFFLESKIAAGTVKL